MSWRGRITVECDTEDCYSEVVYNHDDLDGCEVEDRLFEDGWQRQAWIPGRPALDVCAACVKAAEDAQRAREAK